MDHLDDATLIARGRYATLSSERRALMKSLQGDAEALANYARRILRSAETDTDFVLEEIEHAAVRISDARTRIKRMAVLNAQRDELRPAAWGTTKETE